jgi:cardiolipin synthase C
VEFISDPPGKNDRRWTMGGGGLTTAALGRLVAAARESIVIQTPYLVMSVFSGYRSQRDELLRMGIEIFEYRPDPEVQRQLMPRLAAKARPPVCGLHAKTMVVDSRIVYIGTFNFDPRSENLNTEVGVIIRDETLAHAVASAIETDMKPGNSWSARDHPDQYVSRGKLNKVRMWQLLPIKPIL